MIRMSDLDRAFSRTRPRRPELGQLPRGATLVRLLQAGAVRAVLDSRCSPSIQRGGSPNAAKAASRARSHFATPAEAAETAETPSSAWAPPFPVT